LHLVADMDGLATESVADWGKSPSREELSASPFIGAACPRSPLQTARLQARRWGAVAVSELNPDVVYIGMGETELRGNAMQGDGGPGWISIPHVTSRRRTASASLRQNAAILSVLRLRNSEPESLAHLWLPGQDSNLQPLG
jgi:hypothetical protein